MVKRIDLAQKIRKCNVITLFIYFHCDIIRSIIKVFSFKKFGNAENRTRRSWVRSKNAIHCDLQSLLIQQTFMEYFCEPKIANSIKMQHFFNFVFIPMIAKT